MRAIILLLTCTALVSGCRDTAPAAATTPPAKVENAVKEGELNAVKLTPEAETRVGTKVTAVVSGNVVDTTTVAGEAPRACPPPARPRPATCPEARAA